MHSSLRLAPMLCIMGAIFFFSHQPGDALRVGLFPGADKVSHMLAYGLLAAAVIIAFPPEMRDRRRGLVVAVCLGLVLLYGILDEFHQSYIPARFPEGGDVLADVLGGVLVCGVWYYRGRRRVPSP